MITLKMMLKYAPGQKENIRAIYDLHNTTNSMTKSKKLTAEQLGIRVSDVDRALYGNRIGVKIDRYTDTREVTQVGTWAVCRDVRQVQKDCPVSELYTQWVVDKYNNKDMTVSQIAEELGRIMHTKISNQKLYRILYAAENDEKQRYNINWRGQRRNQEVHRTEREHNSVLEQAVEPTIIPIGKARRTLIGQTIYDLKQMTWKQRISAAAAGFMIGMNQFFGIAQQNAEGKYIVAGLGQAAKQEEPVQEKPIEKSVIPTQPSFLKSALQDPLIANNFSAISFASFESTYSFSDEIVPKTVLASERIDSSTVNVQLEAIVHSGQDAQIKNRHVDVNHFEDTVLIHGQDVFVEPYGFHVNTNVHELHDNADTLKK